MKNVNENEQDSVREGFRNRRIFNVKQEKFGIPNDLFVVGCALSGGLFFALSWWVGLIIGAAYFSVIYKIHKDDPRAAKAWIRGMTRKNSYWAAGEVEPITVTYLSSRQVEITQKEKVKNEIDCLV